MLDVTPTSSTIVSPDLGSTQELVETPAPVLAPIPIATPVAIDEEVNNSFFSFGYSKRKNDAITVTPGYEIQFENSVFKQIQFTQEFQDIFIGLGVDVGDDVNDVLSVFGMIGIKEWSILVEKSKISGVIKTDFVKNNVVLSTFKDNKYTDVKILRSFKQYNKPGEIAGTPSCIGFQFINYERPTVVKAQDIDYYDPKAKLKFYGFVFELDTVKKKLSSGIKLDRHDWYFYNTTSFGYGTLEFSDQTRNGSKQLSKPIESEYSSLGLNGEYELGYLYAPTFWGNQAVLKVGYLFEVEGPLAFSFAEDGDVNPNEQIINHGVNITLAFAF
ncbi:MAG: hypothetical protein HN576_01220 [Bacteriovoracaceae bacterium]|nr:hypothetical protein [Bacteriovoracaceae bacterium]